jgi:hypothetical protein
MKKRFLATLVLAGILVTAVPAPAQGTMYLSGIDLPTAGSFPVGSDAYIAAWFQTGSAPGDTYSIPSNCPSVESPGIPAV